MRKQIWVSIMIGLHTVIHPQVVIHDTITVCPDTSAFSGNPAHPPAKTEIHFFYEPVYNPCGELTYCRPGMVNGVYDPCGGGCYTFSSDFSQVTYTSQIRTAVIPLVNLSESGGSIAFDVSRPQSEIGNRIFAYHITNQPDLRVCWGADPSIPPIGTGTLNVAYGERLFFALQEDVYSPGHIPVEITPICPYEFMVRFENPDLTLWVNGFESGMATYEVVPDTDSVAHGTTVPLDVIAWKQLEEGTEEIPETAELDFTFMSGAKYGTYIGPDSLQADTLRNILYRDVKAGGVRFVANGENPAGSKLVIFSVNASGKECPAGAGIAFVQPAAEYSFRVTFSRDTIGHSDTTAVFVQMMNARGEEVDPPEGKTVKFELDANGQKYGCLKMQDSISVTPNMPILYIDAKAGRVGYLANSEKPTMNDQITVTVSKFDDISITGSGSLFLRSEKVKIRLVSDLYRLKPLRNGQNKANPNYNVNGDERTKVIDFSHVDTTRIHIYVTDAMDKPIKDYPITTTALVVDKSGGHDHSGNRPTGKFICNSDTLVTVIGITDISGSLHYKYLCSGFGGIDSIHVEGETKSDTATAKVLLKRESFVLMDEGTNYRLTGVFGETGVSSKHKVNHYGKSEFISKLKMLADSIFADSSFILRYNDISLINGGPFDIENNWDTPHQSHRNGDCADVDDVDNNKKVLSKQFLDHYLLLDDINCSLIDEKTHFHIYNGRR